MVRVIKRDGKEVDFNKYNIFNCISKANTDVKSDGIKNTKIMDNDIIITITNHIYEYCQNKYRVVSVEEIQDMVETEIIKEGYFEVAKRYIRYRHKRELVRKSNTTDNQILTLIDCDNEEIKQENSNKNPMLIPTQRDYIAGTVSKDLTNRMLLPQEIIEAHNEGIIHFHDSDYFIQHAYNCCLINLEDMLQNGTVISGTMIEKPHSFSTACTVTTQIIAQVASNQYGGQSISLAHLAPFVQISREKIRKQVEEEFKLYNNEITDFDHNKIDTVIENRVKEEIKRGVQTIQYQILTLMTTNGQSPFVSLFMYLGEVSDERTKSDLALIIEEVLKQRYQGVKNEVGVWITPAFPKLLYVLEEDNIHKESKYYYLTELAAKCSAKRLVPDYISEKKMKELKQGYCYPCMGCVDGFSKITYRYKGKIYNTNFFEMWSALSKTFVIKHQFSDDNPNLYMDLHGVEIYDMLNGFVNVQRIIQNISSSWVKVTFDNNTQIICTNNHPFPTINRGRVVANDFKVGEDKVYSRCCSDIKNAIKETYISSIEPMTMSGYSYDVTTDSDHFDVNGIYSHNCRSFLSPWENDKSKYYGRFNKGVVTINLVDVALSSAGNQKIFWDIFEERLALCHKALLCRYERLKGTKSDVAPILWQYGAISRLKKGETIDNLLTDGYSSISLGYAGLWECVYYMTKEKLTTEKGKDFGLKVMQFMNDMCDKWNKELDLGFGIYGSPIESTTYKFSKCLQKRFGIIEGVTDKNYITNSYHVHVTEPIDAFEKLSIESEFQSLSTGGAISYIEVPNLNNNIEAVLEVLKFIYDNIMYAEINTKSDYCQVCGYDGEIQIVTDENNKLIWKCPKCGNTDENKLNVARRTCGYIGSNFWNQGRTQEIKERYIHLGDNE